ncbi:MAG: NAD(P)/FAD-dependent oxidoreductase [Sarcina sp.]
MENKVDKKIYVDILIVGKNRAGLAAAIYCARAGMRTVIVDKINNNTEKIEEHIPDFISIMTDCNLVELEKKAKEVGTEFIEFSCINKMILTNDIKIIELDNQAYFSKAIIITVGDNDNNKYNLINEKNFRGKGIYYSAFTNTDNLREKNVAIMGDNNNSIEEAIYLANIAKKVFIISKDKLMLQTRHQKELMFIQNIKFLEGYIITEILGTEILEGIYLKELKSDKQKKVKLDAIIGFFGKKISIYNRHAHIKYNNDGYIRVDENMMTNINGVFAAGEAIEKVVEEIPVDISTSTIAAMNAMKYIK